MTPAAPIICKPLGTLPLAEVPAFPPAVAVHLVAHEVFTLSDLAPHVEAQGGNADSVRKAFVALGVRKEHLDQATWSLLRQIHPDAAPVEKVKRSRAAGSGNARAGRKPRTSTVGASAETESGQAGSTPAEIDHGEGEGTTIAAGELRPAGASAANVATSGAPTPSPVAPQCTTPVQSAPFDDFDADTPPPRSRPIGDPVKRYVKLQPGESPVAKFHEWDRAGRIPAGSVLCECIFSDFGRNSGLRLAAGVGLGDVGLGEVIPIEKIEGWFASVSIDQRGAANHAVMSREGA